MKAKILASIFIVIVIAGVSSTYYFYSQYKSTQAKYQAAKFSLDNPQVAAEAEIKEITGKLGNLMELPSDETPTLATILDKDKVKDQEFFKKAENGDKVMIYAKAMKAILYRLSSNKIIEVAPISVDRTQQTEDQSSSKKVTPTPTVAE